MNPYDFDRLGVADGDAGAGPLARGRRSRPDRAPTPACPGARASLRFNQPGLDAAALIDSAARVTDVRVETGGALMGDPLLIEPINDWGAVLAIVVGKVLIAFVLLLVATMLMIWFERKLVGDMQNRIGPTMAGPVGHPPVAGRRHQVLLQGGPDPRPGRRRVFILAPFLSLRARPSCCSRSCPSAATSTAPTTGSSRSSATTPTCRWPTRPSASSSRWPCRRSPSTA